MIAGARALSFLGRQRSQMAALERELAEIASGM